MDQVFWIAEARLAQGKAEGKAEAVLMVLAARGLVVSDETRARIMACTAASGSENPAA